MYVHNGILPMSQKCKDKNRQSTDNLVYFYSWSLIKKKKKRGSFMFKRSTWILRRNDSSSFIFQLTAGEESQLRGSAEARSIISAHERGRRGAHINAGSFPSSTKSLYWNRRTYHLSGPFIRLLCFCTCK